MVRRGAPAAAAARRPGAALLRAPDGRRDRRVAGHFPRHCAQPGLPCPGKAPAALHATQGNDLREAGMSSNLEDRLTSTLARAADEAPLPATDPLDAVRGRQRRRRRHRATLAAACAVAVVAVG